MKKLILVSFLLVSLFNIEAFSQENKTTEDLMNLSLEDLLNVNVVSASKKAEKVSEAPGVISVITKDQINSYGWTSLNDILFRQPGFSPSQDYDRTTVSSRGMFEGWNNNHLLLLIDGLPYNDNLYGSAYTSEITPMFITSSVEVLRGPGSALYGSNATNGVTSIKTISAEEASKAPQAVFQIGNFNTKVVDAITGFTGENLSLVLGFNAQSTNGNVYSDYDAAVNELGIHERHDIYDARANSYIFAKIEGKNSLEGLTLQFHRQDWKFQTGHGWLWVIPDVPESMNENRTMLALTYKPKQEGDFSHEYAVRFQRHNIDWNTRFEPNSIMGTTPAGKSEYLKTYADDIFLRAQFSYDITQDLSLLFGVEGDIFNYTGDDGHYSNFDMATGNANPGGSFKKLGPFLEWIKDKPLVNVSGYAQLTTGELLGKYVKATIGGRFDNQIIKYKAIDKVGTPDEDKTLSQFSPRLGLVIDPMDNLTIKLLGGKAFRAPTPTEMFGSNTWLLASNFRNLEPEYITTYEFALDWRATSFMNWRANAYVTKFENQIAYSLQNNNLSTNLYTLDNMGVESEWLFAVKNISGFVNYAFAKRTNEKIFDTTISVSKDEMTWYPSHNINFGANYKLDQLNASVQTHWQSAVKRRASDNLTQLFVDYRGSEVKAWVTVDLKVSYQMSDNFELFVIAKNVFDSENYVVKNFNFAFDYKMLGRYISAGLKVKI